MTLPRGPAAHMPFGVGMQSKVDERALKAPALSLLVDAQFDEEGGLQTRLPYAGFSTNVVGGGTLPSVRRLAVYNDELIAYTASAIYAWSESSAGWVERGLYLAPVVEEQPVFVRTQDQVFADRAELLGVAVTVWTESDAALGGRTYLAAHDTDTGAVIIPPTSISAVVATASRPRVVALSTNIIVLVRESATATLLGFTLPAAGLTPAVVAAALAAPFQVVTTGNFGTVFDVVAQGGVAWVAAEGLGTNYWTCRITNTPATTRVSHTPPAGGAPRVACAISASSGELFVFRWNAGDSTIRGARHNGTTLALVAGNVSMGAPAAGIPNQLTCAFRSVADSGAFRCYVFWSTGETVDGGTNPSTFVVQQNFLDTAGGTGSLLTMIRRMGIGSRAFDYDGQVYLWLVFAQDSATSGMGEPLGLRAGFQNAYFLYRNTTGNHTSVPLAKAAMNVAGGHGESSNLLPGVQSLGGNAYAWAGLERRIVVTSDNESDRRRAVQRSYADRGPREIRLTFDDDRARRCVQLGRTLYLAGSIPSQYDGDSVAEVGFHIFPWYFTSVAGAGSLPAGTRNYKSTSSWSNAAGELDRSTTATGSAVAVPGPSSVIFDLFNLYVTAKKNARAPVSHEMWGTEMDAPVGADYHLLTSLDPSSTGDNQYLQNDPTGGLSLSLEDSLVDADLLKRERFPENGGFLESLPPWPCSIIVATQDRIITAGISDAPYTIRYSRQRNPGEVAAFHELLSVDVPPDGGKITGLAVHLETIYVFEERATYALSGDGLDNLGQGDQYGPARRLSPDVGAVSQEAIAVTPGGILFKSLKGWHLLRGFEAPVYVGGAVAAYDDEEIRSIDVVTAQHQIRILTSQRMLVWDYQVNEGRGAWAEWSMVDGSHSVMWRGRHVVVINSGEPFMQVESFADEPTGYGIDLETAWIKMADLQGFQRIWAVMLLGAWMSAHRVRVRLKRDYVETVFHDKIHTPTASIAGRPLQVRHSPSIQQCMALKVRITLIHPTNDALPPTGEAAKLTGLAFDYGIDDGLNRRLGAASRQ